MNTQLQFQLKPAGFHYLIKHQFSWKNVAVQRKRKKEEETGPHHLPHAELMILFFEELVQILPQERKHWEPKLDKGLTS